MSRVYPPVWCENTNCKECSFLGCDSKVLYLFSSHQIPNVSFEKRPKIVEVTSIAIYFGYCQRLAKFFLLFPQDSTPSIIKENFLNSNTGEPAKVSIQRILLDMLNHGDPMAPTDEVHKIRMMLLLKNTGLKNGRIVISEEDIEFKPTQEEMDNFMKQVRKWQFDLFSGRITNFEKTNNLERCRYCFLEDCEQI